MGVISKVLKQKDKPNFKKSTYLKIIFMKYPKFAI